jgi:hypothetical protein
MGNTERVPIDTRMEGVTRILWRLGWNPFPTYGLIVSMAVFGWFLLQHPIGLILGFLGLIPQWKAISLIASQ